MYNRVIQNTIHLYCCWQKGEKKFNSAPPSPGHPSVIVNVSAKSYELIIEDFCLNINAFRLLNNKITTYVLRNHLDICLRMDE